MARTSSRIKHLELNLHDSSPARGQRAARASSARAHFDTHRSHNTLPPSEEVLERRTHRNRVILERSGGQTRSNIRENFIFLLLLAASIYGTYRLCIYILNL